MIVGMHLDVRGADVNFVTSILQTMIMSLSTIMGTGTEPLCTVVQWTEPQKPMSERLLPLPMPLVMTNHLLLLDKDMKVAVDTMIVLFIVKIKAVLPSTLIPIVVSFKIFVVIR